MLDHQNKRYKSEFRLLNKQCLLSVLVLKSARRFSARNIGFATDNIGDKLSVIICQISLSVIGDKILPMTENNIQNIYKKIGFKKHYLLQIHW